MSPLRENIEAVLNAMIGNGPTPSILTGRGRAEIAAAVEWLFLQVEKEKWQPIETAKPTKAVIVGRRGEPLMALAMFHGQKWRHADSLEPVCFTPNVWQALPDPAPRGET